MNEIDAEFLSEFKESLGFITGEVGDDHSAHSGFFEFGEELFGSVTEDDGVGDHGDDRGEVVGWECFDAVEDFVDVETLIESAGVRGLDGGSVGNGVAVGESEFDEVASAVAEFGDEFAGCSHVGVSAGDKWHEGHAVFRFKLSEDLRDAGVIGHGKILLIEC